MPDTDDDCTCGNPNAHVRNPYTDPSREESYHQVVTHLFSLSTLTCDVDPHLTAMYTACALTSLADVRDPIPTCRAIAWEVARLVNIMSDNRAPKFRHETCGDPTHDHTHEDSDLASVVEFLGNSMEAFLIAACEGQFEASVRIVDAVTAEVEDSISGSPNWAGAAAFFGNIMVSLAVTARHSMRHKLALFDKD